jgi:hypothetical protein
VNKVLDAYEVPRSRDKKTGDLAHPPIVHLIDAQGTLVYTFNNPSARWIRGALEKMQGKSS